MSCCYFDLILIFLLSNTPSKYIHGALELYNTNNWINDSVLYYDCLLYHTSYGPRVSALRSKPSTQILRYCIRPTEKTMINDLEKIEGNIAEMNTFKQMKDDWHINVSVLTMLSIPVDTIERYQEYLEKPDIPFLSEERIYICNSPWFGTYCQYSFDDVSTSFDDIVATAFKGKIAIPLSEPAAHLGFTNLSCYAHLPCDRGPGQFNCLDWREICDGKADCLGSGIDEMGCSELEINECADNEYRCHNGQCVPEEFYTDDPYDADCMDSSDENFFQMRERNPNMVFNFCYEDPTFRCEETDHFFSHRYATCGDGQRSFLHFPLLDWEAECGNSRNTAIITSLLSRDANSHLSDRCWIFLFCFLHSRRSDICSDLYKENNKDFYIWSLKTECFAETVLFPRQPLYDGHIRFIYSSNRSINLSSQAERSIAPDYICFAPERFPFLKVFEVINNLTCIYTLSLGIKNMLDIINFSRSSLPVDPTGNETHCRHSSLFRCPGTTKCISKHRLVDGLVDCLGGADEVFNESCALNDRFRFPCVSEEKCISSIALADGTPQCAKEEDEVFDILRYKAFSFPAICNRWADHILTRLTDGTVETDETSCEHWPCDTVYTRCDGTWHCHNGSDERYCGEPWCEFDHHPCVSASYQSVICLPWHHANDGKIDCLGASDERKYCQAKGTEDPLSRYRCRNSTDCTRAKHICKLLTRLCPLDEDIRASCDKDERIAHILDKLTDSALMIPINIYFQLQRSVSPPTNGLTGLLVSRSFHSKTNEMVNDRQTSARWSLFRRAWLCNRGVLVFVGLNRTEKCLCPPSYYGERCEKQSQRISLTVKFRQICNPDCRDAFGIVFTLLDDDNGIHSQEQRMYVPTLTCTNKIDVYLLFNNRPKNAYKMYRVHIDAYKKADLTHYTSWFFSVQFSFLPVNRMAFRLLIPSSSKQQSQSCSLECGLHGHCIRTINTNQSFCRCKIGWTGPQCSTPYKCSCSLDATCVGPSTCLCPLHQRGSRCFLNSTCHSNPCKNGAFCIPHGEHLFEDQYTCICKEGFSGPTCSTINTRIKISIDNSMIIPQLLLAHFITVRIKDDPQLTTVVQKIPADRDEALIFMDRPFNLIFIQIDTDYYLTLLQEIYQNSTFVFNHVVPNRRCPHISEILDNRTVNHPLLRRVKFFHLLCQKQVNLACFRDSEASLMCICDRYRQANCFQYDFSRTHQCTVLNTCENGAKCYQDRPCPISIVCICPECYYGTRCQFTTKGFGLSLDAILGYQIRRNVSFFRQPIPVKVGMAVTIIMLFAGLLNGICSTLTFQNHNAREVGCGYYLLATSITSIFTMLIFSYKFFFLLVSQLGFVTHRQSLYMNCVATDFLLRASLTIVDWLMAVVAVERAVTVAKGVNFNKKKSRRMSWWIIFGIVVITFASIIHDPVHREIVDDNGEERTWCLVRYSPFVKIYSSVINMIHFLAPFSINIASTFYIITTIARIRSTMEKKRMYKEHLKEQFREHRHILISPIVLVLLTIPRLVLSFISGCMRSGRDPWLSLISYFISFIPPLLIFLIFILPSETYKKQFDTMMKCVRFRKRL